MGTTTTEAGCNIAVKREAGRWIKVPGRSEPVWEPESSRGERLPWSIPTTTREAAPVADDLVEVSYR